MEKQSQIDSGNPKILASGREESPISKKVPRGTFHETD